MVLKSHLATSRITSGNEFRRGLKLSVLVLANLVEFVHSVLTRY
jgi:hypothetical protein